MSKLLVLSDKVDEIRIKRDKREVQKLARWLDRNPDEIQARWERRKLDRALPKGKRAVEAKRRRL